MDVLKTLLAARPDTTRPPGVSALLDALRDASFQLHVCICSWGGVGSTELSNFLTRHANLATNLLTDQDALRHAPRPPQQLGRDVCVVYLVGDPLASVASHYRRQQHLHQALKTSGNPELSQATFPASLEAYVTRGADLFGLEAHLHNWLTTPTAYDVLFVRYEAMFEPAVARAMFAHILGRCRRQQLAAAGSSSSAGQQQSQPQADAMAAAFAASKRQRQSCVSAEQRGAMYGALRAALDALPPIFVRSADATQRRPLLPPSSEPAASAAAAALPA